MATAKQKAAARKNIKKAQAALKRKRGGKRKASRKTTIKRSGGTRKMARKKRSYGRKKYTQVGLVPLGVGINAMDQMGIIDGAQAALSGDIDGAVAAVRNNAGNITNWAGAVAPAIIAGAVRKFVGKVPLVTLGKFKINMF